MKNTLLPLFFLSAFIGFPLAKADVTSVTSPSSSIVYNDQSNYYINSNSVRIRSLPDSTGKILGELSLNDKVRIINPMTVYNQNFIEVSIVLTYDPIAKSEKYFVSTEFLSPKYIDYKEFTGKYFVVVNVATETIRLYERTCPDNSCPNTMILESEVVVGEDINHPKEEKGKGRSVLGSYRVTGWSKFYQDPEGHYPAWYRDGYPSAPSTDASWNNWFSKKVMPLDKKGKAHGSMRGAFGWYTAFVAPNAYGQWTHGTIGWGENKDTFIKKVKNPLINIVSDPRSSGCTRNNNEAIAFLRAMIDVGAPIIKIYAKEEILDPTYSRYPYATTTWNYVLTKTRNHTVERSAVAQTLGLTDSDLILFSEAKKHGGELILDPKSPLNQVLEVGSYERDTHPDAMGYTPGEKLGKFERKIGRKGNVYGIHSKFMHGTFYVDAGMLEGYAHPESVVEVSGFSDEVTPPWMALYQLSK
jgi:hypothetical protein